MTYSRPGPLSLSRRAAFGLAGLILSLGAPAGLLLVRIASGQAALDAPLVEWSRDWPTYLYVALSTAIVFATFGAVLGHGADRLQRLARFDTLTGLRNRAGLAQRLDVELRRARRYGEPLSVVLIDVDRLKDINDRHGHGAGDDALRRIGAAISVGCRASDVAGRWGGDEFLVLAPSTPPPEARLLGDRIRRAVGELRGVPALSVSVGIASVARDLSPPSPEGLLRTADAALYAAKRAGRDQVADERGRYSN